MRKGRAPRPAGAAVPAGTAAAPDGSEQVPDAAPPDAADALSELFLVHSRSLVGLARLLVDDLATAEDVVQDAFAATYRRWGSIRDPEAALPYLKAAVVNQARNRLRARRHGGRVALVDEQDAGRGGAGSGPHPDPIDAVEQRHVVLTALRQLPVRQRQVLVLRYYLDVTEAQAAATLGLSRGAVHRHAVRGSAALAHQLADLRTRGGSA